MVGFSAMTTKRTVQSHYDIFIKDCRILQSGEDGYFLATGSIGIGNGRLLSIRAEAHGATITADRVIEGDGFIAMPGLVNCHTHGAMTLFRGLADDLPLMTWLEKYIFPAEAQFVSEEMVYWCTKLAAAEMLLAGTTTVADAYFYMDAATRAYQESGMRAVLGHGIVDFPAPGVPDPSKNIDTVARFIDGFPDSSRLQPAVFAHSPYTCSAETLARARQLARDKQVPFFIHLAETKMEQTLIGAGDMSPVAYLDSLGILDSGVIAVHCVWVSAADMDILAHRGCRVVTCPESNMKLASGVAPVAAMLARKIDVGLGTDGCASNNDLDLFGEMDSCAKLAKVHALQPELLPSKDVLNMATSMGASCLGLTDIGALQEGMRADLILVHCRSPRLTPFFSPDLLVYGARGADVDTVIVDGKLVVEQGVVLTMDVKEIMGKVRTMAGKIRESHGK
ncbi:MAG: amidohydrolase [Proteobacteria bacterium]|nr:amidohydrolase [Pseudomonadota bacterium]MBU1641441.1 amidohydrolase [Pseudomonadota bacterium]